MPQANTINSWRARVRLWLGRWAERLGLHPAPPAPPGPAAPYPDYVTCPHCGEPEVEVWCNEKTARCHNCGRTFDHAVPPDCPEGNPPSTQTAK